MPKLGPQAKPTRRVIISGTILGLGGIRTHLVLLMKLLRQSDSELLVFATGACWDTKVLGELQSIGVRFVLPPNALRGCRRLAGLYSALIWPIHLPRKANSVYCIGAGRSHLLLQRLRPRGAVSINHEIVIPPGRNSLAGTCAEQLDVTVANSRKVAEVMEGYWPQKPVRVIPFLTSDRPAPPPVRAPGPKNGMLRVAYLGRLVAHKRPQELVRNWKELSSSPELRSANLDIFGFDPSGEMVAELRQFVREAQLDTLVRIHGEYAPEALSRILEATDIVVLPSLDEGLPLVLVEAMSRGVPFVATAAGGTEELGEDNPDVLVTGTDWRDFAAGLRSMAGKVRAAEINARRLHAWVEQRYGFTSVAERWVECLLRPREFFGLS